MNAKIRAVAGLLAALALVALCFETQATNIIRLHVVANSNSAEDQRIKLLVRDAVLAAQGATMTGAQEAGEARRIIFSEGAALTRAVNDVLTQEGAAYGVQLYMGTVPFPEKTYGDETYPAGDYEALRVVLGDGRGDNWWCVMFPPLCLMDLTTAEAQAIRSAKGTVRFKSLIRELWKKWRKEANNR